MSQGLALSKVSEPSNGTGRPVLIIHSWWGLTRSFTVLADRLAEAGFVAGCVDLYGGKIATAESEAQALRGAHRGEPMYRTLQRALVELSAQPRASRSDPAIIGLSMGGHWAIWLAQHPPPAVSAVVLYYSARSGDFTKATSPVLAHFAETDPFVSDSARRKMTEGIAERGLACTTHVYPGTSHWFAEIDHPAYDATSADIAFERTVEFLRNVADR